ncbi:DUF4430 domain-containing protein [Paenibacillus psychroresistens]|uniref:DUF4430 domain-containing protein n=1 Tax=Paenibacillus psychroresistens TaxID=1778678 RepID=A0A6B8RFU7_9BACL|nr:DUF4430 domain-containing protein [Paenibacillus psychroresistens]QGQ95050.1 DUF4430 domain-containing protein [Paenibacillus psychroresistens]
MFNKRWLTAILIIGALAIAFFWGGDYHKTSNKAEEKSVESELIKATALPLVAEDEQPEEASEQPYKTTMPTKTSTPAPIKATETPAVKQTPAVNQTPTKSPKPTATPIVKAEKDPEAKQDKYLTDPVPTGKPQPVEWQDAAIDKSKPLTITLTVSCKTILDNLDIFNKDKLEVLPDDGIIYKTQTVTFYEGESVFDVLLREMKKNKIHMEFSMTPIYNSNYIEGINNLYEFDCGELSGWMYKVNDWFPNYGSSRYVLKAGDVVDWVYTCDLGRDVGGDTAAGGVKK